MEEEKKEEPTFPYLFQTPPASPSRHRVLTNDIHVDDDDANLLHGMSSALNHKYWSFFDIFSIQNSFDDFQAQMTLHINPQSEDPFNEFLQDSEPLPQSIEQFTDKEFKDGFIKNLTAIRTMSMKPNSQIIEKAIQIFHSNLANVKCTFEEMPPSTPLMNIPIIDSIMTGIIQPPWNEDSKEPENFSEALDEIE